MKAFENALVYVYGDGLKKTNLIFNNHIMSFGDITADAEVFELPDDAIVVPGFIDEHIHGAGGADVMDGTESALQTISRTLAEEGTTGFLATTMTQSPENIMHALEGVREYRKKKRGSGAAVLGVHLEGPFIAAAHKGAQPLEYVVSPTVELFDRYNSASGNCIKIVTLAPEGAGVKEFIIHLAQLGVVPSIGHTGAKYSEIVNAVEAGAKNITHTYNAQSPLHHREIGTVGSALLLDELNCELICDTVHVCVPAMRLLTKCKKPGKLTLITDAMRAKGLSDGVSELGGQTVYVNGGQARLADGTLAGSVLRMNQAVRNLVEKVGMKFTQAVDCATITPAQTLKIDGEAGSIELGKNADFAVLDKDYDVIMTVRNGDIIYKK